jgi:hypothetical protein
MSRLNQLAPHTTIASRHRARSVARGTAREARIRRSFDGVVASYIRELWAADDTTSRSSAGPRPRTLAEV